MGVYHFMGLGRSVGPVTAAVSYLAARYRRYDATDAEFFALSGEREQAGKRGDAQALVLFTTPEVRQAQKDGLCLDYVCNPLGPKVGPSHSNDPMPRALQTLLRADLAALAGGRREFDVYWCDVDRSDLGTTFERVARVLFAAKPPDKLGKEVWVNLTGGSNVVNMALQLATALSGAPARLYYLQADDIRLARPALPLVDLGSLRDRFWVELPIVYLAFDAAHRQVLETLQTLSGPVAETELLARLKQGSSFSEMDQQALRRELLVPLRGQQLVLWRDGHVQIGPRWNTFQRYYQVMAGFTSGAPETLQDLTRRKAGWFQVESISLR